MSTPLSELSALARKLNKKADTLNGTIATLNAVLAKLNLGVNGWIGLKEGVPYEVDYKDSGKMMHTVTYLGFCRFERGWEIATQVSILNEDDETQSEEDAQPLLNASRELRTLAVGEFPRLISRMKSEAESLLANIEAAEKSVGEMS
jgi:hypothetical protein